jgi:D-alanyl-D-alanine carboxypeptidase
MPQPSAHGYLALGDQPAADVTGLSPTMGGPGGAVVATTEDVARFYRALLGGDLVRPDLLDVMEASLPGGADGQRLGHGLQSIELPCGTVWGHGGNFPGYLAYAWSSPDLEHQAVVAVNLDPRSLGTAAAGVQQLVSDAVCGPEAARS